jgi:hypothetical protein
MNIAALIAVAIKIAELFGGSSKFAAAVKALLVALSNSPALLEWLTTLLTKPTPAGIPDTAMPIEDLQNDAGLKFAYEQSPEMQKTVAELHADSVPEGAQPIALGGLLTLITYLPQIIALLKQLAALLPKNQPTT